VLQFLLQLLLEVFLVQLPQLHLGLYWVFFVSILHFLEDPWVDFGAFTVGMISACVLFGAIVGCFFGGFISDWIGPRWTLFSCGIVCLLCCIGLSVQKQIVLLLVLRSLSGMGVGCVSSIGPLYVGEQSVAKYRGTFVAVYQFSICAGDLFAYTVNYLFTLIPNAVFFFFV
jgi:MFS family permease